MPGDSEHPVTLGDLFVDRPQGRVLIEYRPATVADLVSALRAEGVLVVEKGGKAWPEWAIDVIRNQVAVMAEWADFLDALAEAQPFPPRRRMMALVKKDPMLETLTRRLSSFASTAGRYNTSEDLAVLLIEVMRQIAREEIDDSPTFPPGGVS